MYECGWQCVSVGLADQNLNPLPLAIDYRGVALTCFLQYPFRGI